MGCFTLGAMIAGAVMERVIGNAGVVMTGASMSVGDRFTLVANLVAIAAVIAVMLAARARPKESLGANP